MSSISSHPIRWLAGIVVACVLFFVAWWALRLGFLHPSHGDLVSDHGAFGDAFAPIVGVLSTLTLAAAVLSVFLQREELALTRKELKMHREAAEDQARATRRANDLAALALRMQAFDAELQVHAWGREWARKENNAWLDYAAMDEPELEARLQIKTGYPGPHKQELRRIHNLYRRAQALAVKADEAC